jgi:glycosyltransferase involved in cell wall biosynthesis
MACGVPVIVSRTRVDRHYFDEQAVRFFTPGDIDDLAAQMLWAYEHPDASQQIALHASRYATEYSWQRHSSEYVTVVDGLACAGAAPPLAEVDPTWSDGAHR